MASSSLGMWREGGFLGRRLRLGGGGIRGFLLLLGFQVSSPFCMEDWEVLDGSVSYPLTKGVLEWVGDDVLGD